MCRHAAFPAGFPRQEAIRIIRNFIGGNTDGVGYSYAINGQFYVRKWPRSVHSVFWHHDDFLEHMPYNDGWTIVHLRNASHGGNTYNNTHPFVCGQYCISHNGVWSEYALVKLALKPTTRFRGQTDSEVAANLINIAGPRKFANTVDSGGTYFALQRDGQLWAIKTSGDLAMNPLNDNTVIVASELNDRRYPNQKDMDEGWYLFDKTGKLIRKQVKETSFFNSSDWSPADSRIVNKYLTAHEVKEKETVQNERFDPEDASNYYINYQPGGYIPSYRKARVTDERYYTRVGE